MLLIDGSLGEGGGQVLRSSLSLSLATGTPFRIEGIRGKRPKPGLLRQHLTAVRAAAAVSGAEVEGDEPGSGTLVFRPGALAGGDVELAVGTAGSVLLVVQTVLPPLLLAERASTLTLSGGTHNPWAPPFEFLQACFLPLLARLGVQVELELVRHGFYPAGGGSVVLRVQPLASDAVVHPLELVERGAPAEPSAEVLLSRLPERIAEEEARVLAECLDWPSERVRLVPIEDSPGPGNVVSVRLPWKHVTQVVTGFGEKRIPARRVAARTAGEVQRTLKADAPVDRFLADQLLVPLALLAGGSYRTVAPSEHTRTNIAIVERFLGPVVHLEEDRDRTHIDVAGRQQAQHATVRP